MCILGTHPEVIYFEGFGALRGWGKIAHSYVSLLLAFVWRPQGPQTPPFGNRQVVTLMHVPTELLFNVFS